MIPGMQNNLPPVQLPTRAAPPTQEAPMLKLLAGISLNNAKNAGEAELDRLGFTAHDIAPSTGDPQADRFIAGKMGALFEHVVVPLVRTRAINAFRMQPSPWSCKRCCTASIPWRSARHRQRIR
jgi:hypothetical protein